MNTEELYDDNQINDDNSRCYNVQGVCNDTNEIPAVRKLQLDAFFDTLKLISGKGYVFFADIKYDFSRWEKEIVDNYELPSEYMYKAGEIWEQWVHPLDREKYSRLVQAAFNGENDKFELSYQVKNVNNDYVPCTCKGVIIRDQNGEPEYFGGVLYVREDARGMKIPEERKKKLDSMFEALAIISDDSNVYLADMHYDYCRWSKGLVEEFELPSEYMYNITETWEELVHPDDKQIYREQMDNIFHFKQDGLNLKYRVRRPDGEYNLCSDLGVLVKNEKGYPEYFGGRIYNHTHHRYYDMVTGLHNQNSFFEDISNIVLNKKEVRIAIIGISKFSEINAVYGYSVGNKVLQEIGKYLIENMCNRSSTYRLDGSRFAVVLEECSYEKICYLYDAMRKYFRDGLTIDGALVTLELDASTIMLNDFDIDSQTIYSCLNFAYIESKNDKYGELVEFKNDSRNDEKLRFTKIYKIRNSITKGNKGFYLLYQPIVNADTEELIGAEALLRWKDEMYGVVPPDEFIPVLESDPLFVDLGDWILKTALEDAKKILDKRPDFVINVNLSYVQIAQADFTDKVQKLLKETGYPAKNLCLEITERCRMLDLNLLSNVIDVLRGCGISVALDDYGTGYSSIKLLKNLPFDTIKIDRSFVLKIEEDDKERILVNNIASTASMFGARTCVEGIENTGMRDILRKYGVYSFQGYYYSKPIVHEELIGKYF